MFNKAFYFLATGLFCTVLWADVDVEKLRSLEREVDSLVLCDKSLVLGQFIRKEIQNFSALQLLEILNTHRAVIEAASRHCTRQTTSLYFEAIRHFFEVHRYQISILDASALFEDLFRTPYAHNGYYLVENYVYENYKVLSDSDVSLLQIVTAHASVDTADKVHIEKWRGWAQSGAQGHALAEVMVRVARLPPTLAKDVLNGSPEQLEVDLLLTEPLITHQLDLGSGRKVLVGLDTLSSGSALQIGVRTRRGTRWTALPSHTFPLLPTHAGIFQGLPFIFGSISEKKAINAEGSLKPFKINSHDSYFVAYPVKDTWRVLKMYMADSLVPLTSIYITQKNPLEIKAIADSRLWKAKELKTRPAQFRASSNSETRRFIQSPCGELLLPFQNAH